MAFMTNGNGKIIRVAYDDNEFADYYFWFADKLYYPDCTNCEFSRGCFTCTRMECDFEALADVIARKFQQEGSHIGSEKLDCESILGIF